MRIKEADYLRAFAIITIVIWHCFVCPLTCWQLIDISTVTSVIGSVASILIPDANMPLFTFISGYLFFCMWENKPTVYQRFKPFISKKVSRLVLPFLVLGTLVNISAPERYLSQIVYGEGSHLWFCMMLFWCFVIGWIEKHYSKKWLTSIILIICFSCFVYARGSNWNMPKFPLGIHNALIYYLYFYFGEIAYKCKGFLEKVAGIGSLVSAIVYATITMIAFLQVPLLSGLIGIFRPFFYCIALLLIVLYFINTTQSDYKWLQTLCTYSFGIYVFHEWLSWDLYHIPVILDLFKSAPVLFASIFSVIDFTISYYLTHFLLKTKVGAYLLT